MPSLGLIIVVIGGIVFGVFTPTEGAAIAVLYAVILSVLVLALLAGQVAQVCDRALVRWK